MTDESFELLEESFDDLTSDNLTADQQVLIKRFAKASREISNILHDEQLVVRLRALYNFKTLTASKLVRSLIRDGCFTEEEMDIWRESENFLRVKLPPDSPTELVTYVKELKSQRAKLGRIVNNILSHLAKEVFWEQASILEKEMKRKSHENKNKNKKTSSGVTTKDAYTLTDVPTSPSPASPSPAVEEKPDEKSKDEGQEQDVKQGGLKEKVPKAEGKKGHSKKSKKVLQFEEGEDVEDLFESLTARSANNKDVKQSKQSKQSSKDIVLEYINSNKLNLVENLHYCKDYKEWMKLARDHIYYHFMVCIECELKAIQSLQDIWNSNNYRNNPDDDEEDEHDSDYDEEEETEYDYNEGYETDSVNDLGKNLSDKCGVEDDYDDL